MMSLLQAFGACERLRKSRDVRVSVGCRSVVRVEAGRRVPGARDVRSPEARLCHAEFGSATGYSCVLRRAEQASYRLGIVPAARASSRSCLSGTLSVPSLTTCQYFMPSQLLVDRTIAPASLMFA